MAEELKPCPTCGEDEPYAGNCGTADSDTRALCKNTPAQQSSQGGEAVEVLAITNRGVCYWQTPNLLDALPNNTQLMTVAQHNRIMAAATPADSRVVPVELLRSMLVDLESGMMCNPDPSQLQQLRELVEQNQ